MDCTALVRQALDAHESLYMSDLVTAVGRPEEEIRATIKPLERTREVYRLRDIIRDEEIFTRSLVEYGKLVLSRRLAELAESAGTTIEPPTWKALANGAEATFRVTVRMPGRESDATFTETELKECANGDENRNV